MSHLLIFLKDGNTNNVSFQNLEEFHASEFHNDLLSLGKADGENFVVDITSTPIISNQLVWLAGDSENPVIFSSSLRRRIDKEDVVFSEHQDRYLLSEYAHTDEDGVYATHRWFRSNGYCQPAGEQDYVPDDDFVYLEGMDDWYHIDDTWYCDSCDRSLHVDDQCFCEDEEDSSEINHVSPYHTSSGNTRYDVFCYQGCQYSGGLEHEAGEPTIPASASNTGESFTITRNQYNERAYHGETFSVCRVEWDGSTGLPEWIFHPASMMPEHWDEVYAQMLPYSWIWNLPSHKNGACHFTMGYKGKDDLWIHERFKYAMPIFMSLWRKRLRNSYGNGNIIMDPNRRRNGRPMLNGKGNLLELRLPPHVKSFEEWWFRHRMYSLCMQATLVNHITQPHAILALVKPLIEEFYGDKAEQRLDLFEDFARVISLSTSELANHCPEGVMEYYHHHLSEERRRAVRAQRDAARLERRNDEHRDVVAALSNPRRRARTNQLGSQFTVGWTCDDGSRRTRTIYVTASGLQYNNSYGQSWGRSRETLSHNPEDFRVTAMCGDHPVIWESYRRAGEDLFHYATVDPSLLVAADVHLGDGYNIRRPSNGNIYVTSSWRYGQGYTTRYIPMHPDSRFIRLATRNWQTPQYRVEVCTQHQTNSNGHWAQDWSVLTPLTQEQYQQQRDAIRESQHSV